MLNDHVREMKEPSGPNTSPITVEWVLLEGPFKRESAGGETSPPLAWQSGAQR